VVNATGFSTIADSNKLTFLNLCYMLVLKQDILCLI
jgi:hypothetical protein